jgi:hypothetical protein
VPGTPGDGAGTGEGERPPQAVVPSIAKLRTSLTSLTLVRGSVVRVPVVADATSGTLGRLAAGERKVTWTSSSARVATPVKGAKSGTLRWPATGTAKVKLRALALGKATLRLRAPSGARLILKVTVVSAPRAPTRVSIAGSTKRLAVGASTTLPIRIRAADSTNTIPMWRSSNPRVARIDAAGRLTARSKGTTTIKLTVAGTTTRRTIVIK